MENDGGDPYGKTSVGRETSCLDIMESNVTRWKTMTVERLGRN